MILESPFEIEYVHKSMDEMYYKLHMYTNIVLCIVETENGDNGICSCVCAFHDSMAIK